MVRIAGFSAYFVELYKASQDDIIKRTELSLARDVYDIQGSRYRTVRNPHEILRKAAPRRARVPQPRHSNSATAGWMASRCVGIEDCGKCLRRAPGWRFHPENSLKTGDSEDYPPY